MYFGGPQFSLNRKLLRLATLCYYFILYLIVTLSYHIIVEKYIQMSFLVVKYCYHADLQL